MNARSAARGFFCLRKHWPSPAAAQPRVIDFPPPGPTRADLLQTAKDEVELLEAHLATRQAHVRAAEVAVEAASRDFSRMSQARSPTAAV